MKFHIGLGLAVAGLAVWGMLVSRVAAADTPPGEPTALVDSQSTLPVSVDGLTAKLPATVKAGSAVCAASGTQYTSESERWTFQGWSTGDKTPCIKAGAGGAYVAQYDHQILILVQSVLPSSQQSMWVTAGVPLDIKAADTVPVGNTVRYRFQQWSAGETPFTPSNRIAPFKPTVLEVKWVKEYLITLEAPSGVTALGGGWYPDGQSVTLSAPDAIPGSTPDDRMKFARWESVGQPVAQLANADKAITTLKVDAPYTLRLVYVQQFRVTASNPGGTITRDWVTQGDEVKVETPQIIEVVPSQTQLVLARWDGLPGLFSSKISGTVNSAVQLTAVYQRQYMVTVTAPYGSSGGGWYNEGTVATVSVPESKPRHLIFKRQFTGFKGDAQSDQATIRLNVNSPIKLAASYKTSVNYGALLLLVAIPLELGLIYLGARLIRAKRSKDSSHREKGPSEA